MKLLSNKDIISLNISPKAVYEWVSESIKQKRLSILPAKISLKPQEDIFYNFMPSLLPSINIAGIKVVNRYPSRLPAIDSQISLYNMEDGSIQAILDGNFITAMRTGAVAVHSIMLFAKKNFEIISFIGLGVQAKATLKILSSIIDNRKLIIKIKKYKNQHIDFIEFSKKHFINNKVIFEICESYEECIRNSDVIISSVTYFDKDIVKNEIFNEGCVVIPIHTRGFSNCDLFFDKVYVDDFSHVACFKYFDKFKNKSTEVTDVILNPNLGRKNHKEKIICYNIGLSIHDLFIANKILQLSENKKIGLDFKF